MSTSTPTCPICKNPSTFVGTAPLKTLGDPVETRFFRCHACDFFHRELSEEIFLENNDVAHYSNLDFADFYRDQRRGYFHLLIDLIQRKMRSVHGDVRNQPRLLDVGCAYGHFLEVASERGFDAVGIEINERNRVYARSNGLTVEESFDQLDGEFDVVTIIDTLYYVSDPIPFLALILERMRPGALIIARVTNRNFEARWRCFRTKSADLKLFVDHTTAYSPRSMRRLLCASGFTGVKVLSESGRGKDLKKKAKRIYQQTRVLASLSFEKIILTPGFYGVGYKSINSRD